MIYPYTAILGLAIAYLLLFVIAETLHHKCEIKAERTRKLVHMGSGLLAMSFPVLFHSIFPVVVLCGSFLILLILSKRCGLLQSIIGVQRKTRGAELFPIIVLASYTIQSAKGDSVYYYLPLLILAIADPIAAYLGQKWPLGQYTLAGHKKTLMGTLGFFMTAMIICLVYLGTSPTNYAVIIRLAILISTGATIAEGIARNGYDNLSIPLAVLGILLMTNSTPIC